MPWHHPGVATDDSDPAILDWGEHANTTVDDPITVTAAPVLSLTETTPHRSLDYLTGREDGFSKGVAIVIEVLAIELRRAGLTDAESRPVCLRVRVRALDMG